jgi:deoxyribose-phosphate aldolase
MSNPPPDAGDASRQARLRRLVGLLDLTSLGSTDHPASVRRLCQRARWPAEAVPELHCAAVCVWPNLAAAARDALADNRVRIACVAAGFPASQSPLAVKTAEVRAAIDAGADEIDVAISRGAFLAGDHARVADELAALRRACGGATLKVILETCELPDPVAIRMASRLAIEAGADFLKTSTGKGSAGATPEHTRILFEEARTGTEAGGRVIGVKAAGGIRTAAQALDYLALADEFLGTAGPDQFRIGASSLLDDLLGQLEAGH